MSNWKLFNRLKGKEDVPTEIEKITEHTGESKEKQNISKIKEKLEEVSIIVYNETLYSKGFVEKNPAIMLLEKKQQLKRLSWESLGTIEHYINDMECTQTELMGDKTQISNNIDQKIDRILSKKNVRY